MDETSSGSVMDPASGLFTAGRDGIYKVGLFEINLNLSSFVQAVVAVKMKTYSEHGVKMWLRRGEEKINESDITLPQIKEEFQVKERWFI